MQNKVMVSGEVQSCVVRSDRTELELLVEMAPDMAVRSLGPQVVPVHIPDHVMLPSRIAEGTPLRVTGMFYSVERRWSLADFVLHSAAEELSRMKWPVDPNAISITYSDSVILASRVGRVPYSDGLNTATLEGEVISQPFPAGNGHLMLRIANYPDEPLQVGQNGKHKTVYANVCVDAAIPLSKGKYFRITDGVVSAYQRKESLAYFVNRANLSIVWPEGFNPRNATIPMSTMSIMGPKLYLMELVSKASRKSRSGGALPYVGEDQLAMYAPVENQEIEALPDLN